MSVLVVGFVKFDSVKFALYSLFGFNSAGVSIGCKNLLYPPDVTWTLYPINNKNWCEPTTQLGNYIKICVLRSSFLSCLVFDCFANL